MPFLIALGLALVLTPAARRAGLAVGLVDAPGGDDLKIHREPIPVLGGLAVVAACLGAAAIAGPGPRAGVLVAAVVAFGTGLADDARPLAPALRLALLAAAGAALATAIDEGIVGAAGAVLLVVASANAVNLIDGQDGLAGGTGAAGALGLATVAATTDGSGALGYALCGALAGFLVWNRPPARIFLGNGGAYAVGALLAALAADAAQRLGWRGLVAAGLCLGVFAFEIAFTVTRRAITRTALTTGDRSHTYDILARAHGRARSSLLVTGIGIVASAAGVAVAAGPAWMVPAAVAAGAAAALAYGRALWLLHARTTPTSTRTDEE